MTEPVLTVVGDDIENPGNVATLLDAAQMFAAKCVFREHAHLTRPDLNDLLTERGANVVSLQDISSGFEPILALDNVPGAAEIYGFLPPSGPVPALVVGNERRGVSRDLLSVSSGAVQIPMLSQRLNCLNVAAATAVALYYLSRGGVGGIRTTVHPEKRRPEILFLAPSDHVELGSSIRSAGAFGWQRIMVEDTEGVWFGIERSVRAEGRAAARRSRNPIRVIPSSPSQRYAFDEVCVITLDSSRVPLSRAKLDGGQRQLLVMPDVEGINVDLVDWERFGKRVSFATLNLPAQPSVRHFRLDTSIALAEAARQVGRPPTQPQRRRPSRAPQYDRVLRLGVPDLGEVVYLEELESY